MTLAEYLRRRLKAKREAQIVFALKSLHDAGSRGYEAYMIAAGQFKEMGSEINRLVEEIKKLTHPDSDDDSPVMTEPGDIDHDDTDQEDEEPPRPARRTVTRQPRTWGAG